jgi:hypothetical protein
VFPLARETLQALVRPSFRTRLRGRGNDAATKLKALRLGENVSPTTGSDMRKAAPPKTPRLFYLLWRAKFNAHVKQ